MAGITVNGPSGIDTTSLINQLVGLQQANVTTVQNQVNTMQTQISDYSNLKSLVSDVAAKAMALDQSSDFDLFTPTSTDDSSVTIAGGDGAIEGSYDVSVYQLAKSETMISKDNQVTDQTKALSQFGVNAGDISINGTTITIASTDTIQDVRMKINNATDANGNKLGVTASVLQVSPTDFRLVLQSTNTGAAGNQFQDLNGGTTLEDLGVITDAAGDKGNTTQTVGTTGDFQTMFDSLTAGTAITYAGVDHDGNQVTNTFVKTSDTESVNDFLSQVNTSYHNMATATIDSGTGKLVLTDAIAGTSQLAINSLVAGGASQTVTVTQSGANGAGVLTTGSNSYFSLDGLLMNNASNSPANIVAGVTLTFHKTNATPTTVTLARDVAGLQKVVQNLVDSYNALQTWAATATKPPDPTAEAGSPAAAGGDLANDMTVEDIVSQVTDSFESQFGLFGGSVNSLDNIGLTTDPTTGQMSIDSTAFASAVTQNFDQFERLFVTSGISDNKNVVYGRSTDATQSGSYTLRETDPNTLQIQLAGDSTWYTSNARMGDVVTFGSGPASGLSITSPSGILGGVDTNFTFQSGLSDTLQNLCNSITDSDTGQIANHVDSLNTQIADANSRISTMQENVDDYRTQLTNQFAAMEEALMTMKNQYASMASALGLSTSSSGSLSLSSASLSPQPSTAGASASSADSSDSTLNSLLDSSSSSDSTDSSSSTS
jgi:flagellar capping protein FliD